MIQHSDGETDEVFQGRLDPGWQYEKRLTRQDGSWVVAELRIFPHSTEPNASTAKRMENYSAGARADVPRGGLTARHLRRIPFGEGPASGLKELDALCVGLARLYQRQKASDQKLRRLEARTVGRLTRKQTVWERDLELARVANFYVQVRREGSRHPNVDVAKILKTTAARIRDAIHKARKRGLVTQDDQKRKGAAKGELTDRARAILANEIQITTGEGIRALARAYGVDDLADSVPSNEGRKAGR